MAHTTAEDTIDRVAGLTPDLSTYATRHQRAKVVAATQGSEQALFDPALAGLTLIERLCVALYACRLTPSEMLAREYGARLEKAGADPAWVEQVLNADISHTGQTRLSALLAFTHALITDPVKADQTALLALKEAGLSTPEVVTLAQLISFVSYQVRLAAGLAAMKALEQQP